MAKAMSPTKWLVRGRTESDSVVCLTFPASNFKSAFSLAKRVGVEIDKCFPIEFGELKPDSDPLIDALRPLARIADAYDANDLDDEARRFWGPSHECENRHDPKDIEIYAGRGGRRLLTLADCFAAREAIRKMEG